MLCCCCGRLGVDASEVKSGFERSTAEAVSSFGDGRMLVEKYVENGHHIEIQVMEILEMAKMAEMTEMTEVLEMSEMLEVLEMLEMFGMMDVV